jgi:hypothetical protein
MSVSCRQHGSAVEGRRVFLKSHAFVISAETIVHQHAQWGQLAINLKNIWFSATNHVEI